MPIVRVPKGTIREEDQPIHKIAMLRTLDPSKQTAFEEFFEMGGTEKDWEEEGDVYTERRQRYLDQKKQKEHPWAPGEGDRPTELERRKAITEANERYGLSKHFADVQQRAEGGYSQSQERLPNQYEINPENISLPGASNGSEGVTDFGKEYFKQLTQEQIDARLAEMPGKDRVKIQTQAKQEQQKQEIDARHLKNAREAMSKLGLSSQEARMYGRHITNLKGPGGVDHPNGARSTLMNMGVELDGKYYNLPRVYDGKILSPDEAVGKAKDQGLENFPSYKNREEAENRYKEIHKYMEKDAQQFYRREAGGPLQERSSFPIADTDIDKVPRHGGNHNDSREHMGPRGGGRHAGLDIPAKPGSPVLATHDGTVLKTGYYKGYGHFIDTQMSDGTVHRFAHLGNQDKNDNNPKVLPYGKLKVGDSFKSGDTLGFSGYSGNAEPNFPHVHAEIFPNRNVWSKYEAGNSRQTAQYRLNPRDYYAGGRDAAVKEGIKQLADTGGKPSDAPAGNRREVAQTLAKELRAAGYPDNSIAGIMRNVQEESSFNPKSLTRDDQKDPKFAGTEARHGHGLFSEGGDEFNNMQAWMKEKHPNSHWSDTKVQSEWIAHRLKTGYPKLDQQLRDPSITKEGAADAFLKQYLKPSADNLNRRSAYYQKGIPGVEHYTGAMAPTAPAATPKQIDAATTPAPETPPTEGPVSDPSIAARQREMSQRPAPGPEDPSIQARAREQEERLPLSAHQLERP